MDQINIETNRIRNEITRVQAEIRNINKVLERKKKNRTLGPEEEQELKHEVDLKHGKINDLETEIRKIENTVLRAKNLGQS
jgi:predicted  nucleic acid-binding Zn-ribbon protein